jgi:hypothetical protein
VVEAILTGRVFCLYSFRPEVGDSTRDVKFRAVLLSRGQYIALDVTEVVGVSHCLCILNRT